MLSVGLLFSKLALTEDTVVTKKLSLAVKKGKRDILDGKQDHSTSLLQQCDWTIAHNFLRDMGGNSREALRNSVFVKND